jgi:hypothetical protein
MKRTLFFLAVLLGSARAQAGEPPATAPTPPAAQVATATAPASPDVAPALGLLKPSFGEDARAAGTDWAFGFHGYARMPVRFNGAFSRSPYLVDDNYFLSGFAYTRLSETEWAEVFFSAQKGKTRFVLGLFASQFSDWSEMTLQGQGGIATAMVEHEFELSESARLGVRAGMFWDRYGYTASYDTYLLGRMHIAGLRLELKLWDTWYTRVGFGAHAEVVNANQGFTPVFYFTTGLDFRWIDASLFAGTSWTHDSERAFSIIKDGSLTLVGGELRIAIPRVGPLSALLSFLSADQVVFLANAFEILHSTGGRGLTQSFFGPDSNNGTGQILMGGLELTWQLQNTFGSALRGLDLRLFAMTAWVASKQRSDDPLQNFDDRVYVKWGTEIFYRLPFEKVRWLFGSFRFDRVILDYSHDSLAFRAVTPRIGVTPIRGWNLDIFVAYTKYFYGDRVQLRPNQIPGDNSATRPDDQTLKIQAQVTW